VLAAHPDDPLALALQGELDALSGNAAAGLQSARRALSQHPLEPMRYFHEQAAALAAWAAGEPLLAVELAERSVQAQPGFVPGWWTLAIAQVAAQQLPDAHRAVSRLLELQPLFSIDGFLRATPAVAPVAQQLAQALALAGAPRFTSVPAASS
jgi:predicted Zn-dependent protease